MSSKSLIIVAAITSMVLGFVIANNYRSTGSNPISQVQDFQGALLSTPRKISMPTLKQDDGTDFTGEDLRERWTLMFFGYTHCPDICPTTMNTLAQAKQKVPEGFPEVVFVSVDPERDKIDMLGEYVKYFDPSFKGVTGDEELIKALTLQMSAVYMRTPVAEDGSYLVDHSSSVMVLNPEGNLAALISPPHTPSNILKALESIQK